MLQLLLRIEPTFVELFQRFQRELTLHYNDNGHPLYSPQKMKEFAERCAPGLFDQVHNCIMNDVYGRPTNKRQDQQLQRTVSILHTMSYFRNQVVNIFKANF